MAMDTTTDRTSIPKLDEAQIVQAGQFQLAKYTAPVTALIVAVSAGVLPNTGLGPIPKVTELDKSQQGVVVFGILLVIGLTILGLTLVWSADIRARAEATCANLALRALPTIVSVSSPPGAAGQSSGLWVTLQRTGADDEYLVIGARKVADEKTEFFLAKGNDRPQWGPEGDVTSYLVKTA